MEEKAEGLAVLGGKRDGGGEAMLVGGGKKEGAERFGSGSASVKKGIPDDGVKRCGNGSVTRRSRGG